MNGGHEGRRTQRTLAGPGQPHDPVRVVLREIPSPLGLLVLAGDGVRLSEIAIGGRTRLRGPSTPDECDPGAYPGAAGQLAEYFAGRRRAFAVPFVTCGTAFEEAVWAAIAAIPYGETRSYAEVAAAVGRPGAARAVGQAAGRNPLPILVPCHRVVGADHRLVGYGGGLSAKKRLLALEAAAAGGRDALPPPRPATSARSRPRPQAGSPSLSPASSPSSR